MFEFQEIKIFIEMWCNEHYNEYPDVHWSMQ